MSEAVKAFFDGVASCYDGVLPFYGEFGKLVARALPGPRPGATLLDIGAGRGAIAVPAQERGYRVTAIDASPAMVARLAAERPDLDARVMDAARLGFADGTFDVVTAGFVMHLLDDPEAVIGQIRLLLKPGGLLAFTTPGRVPDGFEFADGAHDLFAEFARYLPPGRAMGAGFGELAALAAAGFISLDETDIRVELPVPDAETFWAWIQSCGSRQILDELGEAHRAELRRRLMADLESRDPLVLRRYAWLFRGRAPLALPLREGYDS